MGFILGVPSFRNFTVPLFQTCPVCLTEAPTESTQADMICDSGAGK